MKKHSCFYFCSAAVVIAAVSFSCAAETQPVTLRQCLEWARHNNERSRIQEQQQLVAGEHLAQAHSSLLPTVDAVVSRREYRNGSENAASASTAMLTVSQSLFNGFRDVAAVTLARAEIQREEYSLRELYRALDKDVIAAFFNAARVDADIAVTERTIALMQDRIRELEGRVRLGKSRHSEVLMTRSSLSSTQAERALLDGDRFAAQQQLALVTGADISSSTTITLPADAAPAALAEFVNASAIRSDIRTLEEAIALRNEGIRIAHGASLPSLSLDGTWYLARQGEPSGGGWNVLLSLTAPLYRGGALRSRVREERLKLEQDQQSLALLKRTAAMEVKTLYAQVDAARCSVNASSAAYNMATESYALELADYRRGLVENLEVLQSLTAVLNTERARARAHIELQKNSALLDAAAGHEVTR